jgi:hypothetical protein
LGAMLTLYLVYRRSMMIRVPWSKDFSWLGIPGGSTNILATGVISLVCGQRLTRHKYQKKVFRCLTGFSTYLLQISRASLVTSRSLTTMTTGKNHSTSGQTQVPRVNHSSLLYLAHRKSSSAAMFTCLDNFLVVVSTSNIW